MINALLEVGPRGSAEVSGKGTKTNKDSVINCATVEQENTDDFLTKFLLCLGEVLVSFYFFGKLDRASIIRAGPSMGRVSWSSGERVIEAFQAFDDISR